MFQEEQLYKIKFAFIVSITRFLTVKLNQSFVKGLGISSRYSILDSKKVYEDRRASRFGKGFLCISNFLQNSMPHSTAFFKKSYLSDLGYNDCFSRTTYFCTQAQKTLQKPFLLENIQSASHYAQACSFELIVFENFDLILLETEKLKINFFLVFSQNVKVQLQNCLHFSTPTVAQQKYPLSSHNQSRIMP